MFGQVVIGPPGSGKSTYCNAMGHFLETIGRQVAVVNLDPANDCVPYECKLNIQSVISLENIMQSLSLGPNGGLLYCMEWLETHLDWLKDGLDKLSKNENYIIIDMPGQVELFTHNGAVRQLLKSLEKWGHRLVTVHLTDSHYCTDPGKFVSVLLTSLNAMLQLETPHINVLSKMDLIEKYGQLPFNLDYFTNVNDLKHLVEMLDDDPFTKKYKQLNSAICSVIEDYAMVSFQPLNVNDKESMLMMLKSADQANGYCYYEKDAPDIREVTKSDNKDSSSSFIQKAQERYCS